MPAIPWIFLLKYNPTAYDVYFHHPDFPVTCKAVYKVNSVSSLYDGILNKDIDILKSDENVRHIHFKTVVPELPAGNYLFTLALDNTVCAAQNSNYVSIKILTK